MKKRLSIGIFLLMAVVMLISACGTPASNGPNNSPNPGDTPDVTVVPPGPTYVRVTSIAIEQDSFVLVEGEQTQASVTFAPANATNRNIFWSVANDQIATISDSGAITALRDGVTTVTAESFCGGFISYRVVTVAVASDRVATGIRINGMESGTITVGRLSDPITLSIGFVPALANRRAFTIKSSDESVATVATNGRLTYWNLGSTYITVICQEEELTATIELVVDVDGTTSVDVDRRRVWGAVGALPAYVRPVFSAHVVQDRRVVWTSNNPGVATVDNSGRVTFVSVGTATLSVVTYCGTFTAPDTIEVRVVPANEIVWIRTPYELQALDNLPEAATDRLFMLANDIDFALSTITNFNPIGFDGGEGAGALPHVRFMGTFDGNGFAIRNMVIDGRVADEYLFNVGLFVRTHQNATVRNLSIIGGSVRGRIVGAVAGYNRGIIENVFVQTQIIAPAFNWNGMVAGGNTGVFASGGRMRDSGRIYNVIVDSSINDNDNNRLIAGRNWSYIEGVFVNADRFATGQMLNRGMTAAQGPRTTYMDSAALTLAQLQQASTFASWSNALWTLDDIAPNSMPTLRPGLAG